ncbi:MAG: phosphonate metabolism transcriptional regulator PhnF [Pseudomonadota bacterium]
MTKRGVKGRGQDPVDGVAARPRPLWAEIRATLAREITDGRYGTGAKLPSEQALATRFNVNRHTVRRALADLAEAGLIHVRRGAGATVLAATSAAPGLDYTLGPRTRFSENLRAAGRLPGHRMLRLEALRADAAEAEALDIPTGGPVLAYESISTADGVPLSYARSVFAHDRLPGIGRVLSSGKGITAALAAAGIADYRRRSTRVNAVLPSSEIARHLAMGTDEPVIVTTAIDVSSDGVPLRMGRTFFCANRVTLVVEEPRLTSQGDARADSEETR